MATTSSAIAVGDTVLALSRFLGTVRYVGKVEGLGEVGEVLYGIELNRPLGRIDGSFKGKKYFECKADSGRFFIRNELAKGNLKQILSAVKIQSLLRSRKSRRETSRAATQKAWNTLDSDAEGLALERGKKTFGPAEVALQKHLSSFSSAAGDDEAVVPGFVVEDDYTGPRPSVPPTLGDVIRIMQCFKNGNKLHIHYAMRIIEAVTAHYELQTTVQEIPLPEGTKMTIVGDLHGQLQDLFTIFTINGLPSPTNMYFFNGDFVDRGYYGVEIVLTLFSFKLLYPGAVHMNRGNHECRQQNAYMGFEDEVLFKYEGNTVQDPTRAWRIYDAFHEAFQQLPLCAVLGGKVAIMHGGLFGKKGITFKHLNAIKRAREPPLEGQSLEDKLFEQILWSDPRPTSHFPVQVRWFKPSDRGAGVEFGVEMTNQFCRRNKVALIIRSHECVQDGYEVLHGGRLITIFSASHYCQKNNNKGAFITFTHKMEPEIQQFVAHDIGEFNISDFVPSSKTPPKVEVGTTTVGSEGAKESEVEDTARHAKVLEDVLKMLTDRIIDGKVDLYWWYMQAEQVGDGKVSLAHWAEGLHDCLQLELPFMSYREHLVDLEADGSVNYVRFLERHRVMHHDKDWQKALIHKICERLYNHCHNFTSAYKFFDQDHDGYIQYQELADSLQKLEVGLKKNQVYELMRALDVSEDNKVSFDEFRNLFQVEFSHVSAEHDMHSLLERVGHLLFSSSGSGGPTISDTFMSLAHGHSGMSYDEFANGMRKRLGDKSPTVAELTELAEAIDTEKNGQIDINEFLSAFQVKFKHLDEGWKSSVLEQISIVLYQHKQALLQMYRRLDTNHEGLVTQEQFMDGIKLINEKLHQQIDDAQVRHLLDILDKDNTGKINYQVFLNKFSSSSPSLPAAAATKNSTKSK